MNPDQKPNADGYYTLTEEQKAQTPNSSKYEFFILDEESLREYDEEYFVPVRPNIVATYTEHGMGYLIQKLEGGYRYISVEAGEEDEFGPLAATQKAAIQSAVNSWRSYGGSDSWAHWTKQLIADASAPDAVDASELAEFLTDDPLLGHFAPDVLSALAGRIAAKLNG